MHPRIMRLGFVACCAVTVLFVRSTVALSEPGGFLPNGWYIAPAGQVTNLGTLPMHMVEDPTGRYIAVTTGGYGALSISLIDEQTGKVIADQPVGAAFYGLAFADQKLYASTATGVATFTVTPQGTLTPDNTIAVGAGDFGVTGIAASKSRLYIADGATNDVIADDPRGAQLWKTLVGQWPYSITLSRDANTAYVSDWGSSTVSVLDATSGALKTTIPVGSHPNAELLSPDGATLYVACANDDAVDAIDTTTNSVRFRINVGIFPDELPGAIPNGLALSPDARTLFVADAGDNAVVAVDLTSSSPVVYGAIAAGWYPTDVIVNPRTGKVFILDGKGVTGHANPTFPHIDVIPPKSVPDQNRYYVATLATGDIETLSLPNRMDLEAGLNSARLNSRYTPKDNIVREAPEQLHIIYVIKENRTYDEVLGDDPRGNGDSHLTIFGRRITPNIHRLADDFVLLDNFDTDAAVSADGHNWSTAAYANDYVEKLWPATYSGRRKVNGKIVYDYEQEGPASPPGGYLWDDARKSRISIRDYGEFVHTDSPGHWVPSASGLDGIIDPRYYGFDLAYTDVDRINEWLREFHDYVQHRNLPQLEIVRLPNDHTAATRPGSKTPYAMLADNDYALGRLVEAVSHSPYWRDTIIFCLEDDAQAGPDHISDHRAEALMIGARVQRGVVDHTHYTTSSMLHTIETLLGMPPMSQFDAGATSMIALLTDEPNTRPWKASSPLVNLNGVNGPNPDGKTSMSLKLDEADAADPATMNAILWRYAHTHQAR